MSEPKDLPGWHAVLSHESGRETWSKMIDSKVPFANCVKREGFLANHVGKDWQSNRSMDDDDLDQKMRPELEKAKLSQGSMLRGLWRPIATSPNKEWW